MFHWPSDSQVNQINNKNQLIAALVFIFEVLFCFREESFWQQRQDDVFHAEAGAAVSESKR